MEDFYILLYEIMKQYPEKVILFRVSETFLIYQPNLSSSSASLRNISKGTTNAEAKINNIRRLTIKVVSARWCNTIKNLFGGGS